MSVITTVIFAGVLNLVTGRALHPTSTHAPEQLEVKLSAEDFRNAELIPDQATSVEFPTSDGMFEGDINLNGHSIEEYMKGEQSDEDNIHRNGVRSIYRRWAEGVVPYTISSSFNAYERSRIAAAIQDYNKFTCIRWVPRTSQTDYVHMFKGNGCYSQIGRTGFQQPISIGHRCAYKGVIIHEMMHALGFFHEQSRDDRDSFITVRTENIIPEMKDQFHKYSLKYTTYLNTSYDYDSIMHYGPYFFSKNGRPTIEPKQPGVTIGQQERLSQTDIVKLNRMYKCDERATLTTVSTATATALSTTPPPSVTTAPTSRCRDRTGCRFFKRFDPDCTTARVRASCNKSCGLCDDFQSTPSTISTQKPPALTSPSTTSCRDERTDCIYFKQFDPDCHAPLMQDSCKHSCGLCRKF